MSTPLERLLLPSGGFLNPKHYLMLRLLTSVRSILGPFVRSPTAHLPGWTNRREPNEVKARNLEHGFRNVSARFLILDLEGMKIMMIFQLSGFYFNIVA